MITQTISQSISVPKDTTTTYTFTFSDLTRVDYVASISGLTYSTGILTLSISGNIVTCDFCNGYTSTGTTTITIIAAQDDTWHGTQSFPVTMTTTGRKIVARTITASSNALGLVSANMVSDYNALAAFSTSGTTVNYSTTNGHNGTSSQTISLTCAVVNTTYSVTTSVSPENSGIVNLSGTYPYLTLTATPESLYEFVNWTVKGYTQLEYIESTGTQYIDTGYNPTSNISIESEFETTEVIDSSVIFGIKGTAIASRYLLLYNHSPSEYGYTVGSTSVDIGAMTAGYSNTFSCETGVGTILNGVETTITTTFPGVPVYSITLFALNTRGTIDSYSKTKMKSFKIYESGAIVRNFIPAFRHSDAAIGLFDLVGMKFYANSGTGVFIGGPVKEVA